MWLQLLSFRFLAGFQYYLLLGNFPLFCDKVRRYPCSSRPWSAELVNRACASMNRACVLYPAYVRCLQRSAATTCLLRRYGVPAQMAVGSQLFPFRVHAWVELNGRILNDQSSIPEMYAVLDRC